MLLTLKSLNDVVAETPDLLVHGDWLCINIDTNTPWPNKPQRFTFEGHELWVMPHTNENYAGLAINRPGNLTQDDTWALLHRALSLLAWGQDSGATVVSMSGGNLPRMMGRTGTRGVSLRDSFDLSDLQQVGQDRARVALALMREGRGLNHPAYAFLSFFRALETAIPEGRLRGQWVTDNIDDIQGHAGRDALAKLRGSVADVGVHLRESGRHAIAHAAANPIINPDDPRDARRLQTELPIIEALAVLAIERRLGIQTRSTIWREHLYELRGWKPVFGEELLAGILAGQPPADGTQIDAPMLNVRLRRSDTFIPFEGMSPFQLMWGHERVEIVYRSESGRVDLIFHLNFATERLEFSMERGIAFRDDGTVDAAHEGKALDRFARDYFGNGELQMWSVETGALISRCDAYIPVNMRIDIEAANAAIDRWDGIIEERRGPPPKDN